MKDSQARVRIERLEKQMGGILLNESIVPPFSGYTRDMIVALAEALGYQFIDQPQKLTAIKKRRTGHRN